MMEAFQKDGLKMAIWAVHELNQTTRTEIQLLETLDRAVNNSSANLSLYQEDYQELLKEVREATVNYRSKAKELLFKLQTSAIPDDEEVEIDLGSEIQQNEESAEFLQQLKTVSKSEAKKDYKLRQVSQVKQTVSKYCEAFLGGALPGTESLNCSFTSKCSFFTSQAPSVLDCHHNLREMLSELRGTSKKLMKAEKEIAELRNREVERIRGKNEDDREERSFETDCLATVFLRQQGLARDSLHRVEWGVEKYQGNPSMRDNSDFQIVESFKTMNYTDDQGVPRSISAVVKCNRCIEGKAARVSFLFLGCKAEGTLKQGFRYSKNGLTKQRRTAES